MIRGILTLLLLILDIPLIITQVMGPFDIEFKGMNACKDVVIKNPFMYNIKYNKVSRKKYTMSFDIYAPHGVNDDIDGTCTLAVKTNNGFKSNFYELGGPLVTTGKAYLPQYFNKVKFPLPPGNYSVKNEVMDLKTLAVPTFFYNTFRATGTLYRFKQKIACFEILLDIVPKKKKS